MRTLIIGDLHCRSIWKDIVAKEGNSCDRIVFLGDYTCPREVQLSDPTDACGFLYEVLDYKDKNPDKVVLLRGNHDLGSLGYYWAQCWPQDYPKVQQYWQTNDVKNWFLKNSQWVYRIPDTNIVCSHAGVGEKFLENVQQYLDRIGFYNPFEDKGFNQCQIYLWTIENINNIEPCELFGFTDDNPFDTCGESKTQPCTWIRPQTLMDYGVKDIIHVVGHTPVGIITNLKEECLKYSSKDEIDIYKNQNSPDIWCCDCLMNNQYLIIEDNKFIPSKI